MNPREQFYQNFIFLFFKLSMFSPIVKNICMIILLIIFLFLLSNDNSWNSFFQKKESIKYLLLFFFIYLTYYQFNISLLILPILSLHLMTQPSFREKILQNPIWNHIKEKIQLFTEQKDISNSIHIEEKKLVLEENQKEEESSSEFPEILQIHDDASATPIKKERDKESTELSFEELEELYTSLNRQLEELNK